MMLGGQDIYLNVVGGLKINEPSIDLGILAATASSFKKHSNIKRHCNNGRSWFNRRS